MAANDHLLTLPGLMGQTIRLAQPCIVGYQPSGEPLLLDTLDPRSFGRSFLAHAGPNLVWRGRTEVKSLDKLKDLYGFHCGAIVSRRARAIIESQQIPNVEFIPVEIFYKNSDTVLGSWWFVNVFNWRKLFDLERSKATYQDFADPAQGLLQISRRFGGRLLADWQRLEVVEGALEDGLALAEAPAERIWSRVFISQGLAEKLNDGLSKDRQIYFEKFWLDGGRWPQFDQFGFR